MKMQEVVLSKYSNDSYVLNVIAKKFVSEDGNQKISSWNPSSSAASLCTDTFGEKQVRIKITFPAAETRLIKFVPRHNPSDD